MRNELVIPFSDLRFVSIECGACEAVLVLDIEGPHDVTSCSACNREFEPSLKSALDRLHTLYLQMENVKYKLAFRIASPAGPS